MTLLMMQTLYWPSHHGWMGKIFLTLFLTDPLEEPSGFFNTFSLIFFSLKIIVPGKLSFLWPSKITFGCRVVLSNLHDFRLMLNWNWYWAAFEEIYLFQFKNLYLFPDKIEVSKPFKAWTLKINFEKQEYLSVDVKLTYLLWTTMRAVTLWMFFSLIHHAGLK